MASAPALGADRASTSSAEPLRATTFTVVDLETTGGSAASDAITEIGAVRVCGGEVLGEFQTLVDPGVADHARSSACSPASPTRWSPARAGIGAVLPVVPRVRPRQRARRPQRPVRRRVPAGRMRACIAAAVAAASRWSTPPSWRGGCSPATRCRTASSRRSPAFFQRRDDARTTVRCTTRGPPSTCCTGSSRGSAASACSRCRNCARSPRRSPTRSAANGTSPTPAARARRLHLPRRRRAPRSTSAPAETCAPGCASTSSRARPAPGWAR